MRSLECFYQMDFRGMQAINKVLVALLPKKDGVVKLKDFRPVCLIHGG